MATFTPRRAASAGLCLLGAGLLPGTATADFIHDDDVIITFSLCIGNDCVNGENFGFDTLRLKENNLRIHFDDTSNSASFPSNDWRIVVNDSANGGADYFAIEDSTAGRQVFRVDAGAPANSLYVDGQGDVGLNTSTPATELHIADGDTPTVRLEQNGSSGFTPQTWDMAGNETNFFIRDVTNGSTLPFRIQPGAPTSSVYIANDGQIGMGAATNPDAPLEVRTTGGNIGTGNAVLKLVNVAGATGFQLDPLDDGTFWNATALDNDTFRISRSGTGAVELSLASSGDLTIRGSITTGGPTCAGGCDRVFAEDYDLPSIGEHASLMLQKGHLPAVGPTEPLKPVNLSEQMGNMLNELEKAHIYIAQLHERIEQLEAVIKNRE